MADEQTYGGHTAKQLSALWDAAPGEPTDYDGYTKPAASDFYNALLGSLPDLLAAVEALERHRGLLMKANQEAYAAMQILSRDYVLSPTAIQKLFVRLSAAAAAKELPDG